MQYSVQIYIYHYGKTLHKFSAKNLTVACSLLPLGHQDFARGEGNIVTSSEEESDASDDDGKSKFDTCTI